HVADVHLIFGRLLARPVLGETFGPPVHVLRRKTPATGVERLDLGQLGDLEGVDQLVAQRLEELRVVAAEREGDPAFEVFREPEDALGDEARVEVRLLEVLVRRVDDEGDAFERMVPEPSRELLERFLGVGEGEPRDWLLLGVVVDVDVFAVEDVPLEVAVLDLVLPERDRLALSFRHGREQGEEQEGQSARAHVEGSIASILSSWRIRSTTSIPSMTRPKTV